MDLRIIRSYIMGILDKNKKTPKKEIVKLEKPELEFLLKMIADSKFDGKDVQVVYAAAVKLQKLLTE